MTPWYDSQEERNLYLSHGKHLALELGEAESLVMQELETEVERMMSSATIKDFIPVLAAKHVKEHFRSRG